MLGNLSDVILRVVYQGETYDLTVDNSVPVRLDISAVDNATIGTFYGVGSQEFNLPGTKENNEFFNYAYTLVTDNIPGFYEPIEAYVIYDSQTIVQGTMQLLEIMTDVKGYTNYKVIVSDKVLQLNEALADKYVKDGDFSPYTHTISSSSIYDSWDDNLLNGNIFYPLIDYGTDESVLYPTLPRIQVSGDITLSGSIDNPSTPMMAQQFLPAIRAKELVKVILKQAGFTYTSSFLETSNFGNLYVLPKGKEGLGIVPADTLSNNANVQLSGDQTINSVSPSNIDPQTIQFNSEVSDPGNNFNTGTYKYIPPLDGNYTFDVKVKFDNIAVSSDQYVEILLNDDTSTLAVYSIGDLYGSGNPYEARFTTTLPLQKDNGISVVLNVINSDTINSTNSGYIYASDSYFKVINSVVSYEGSTVNMSLQFDPETKSLDLLKGLIEKFNLIITPEPGQSKVLRIEPFDIWMSQGGRVDWTTKFNDSDRIAIKNTITEQPRLLKFTDAEDSDRFSKQSKESFPNEQYGTMEVLASSSLAQGEKTIGSTYGPVILGSATQYGLADVEGNPLYSLSESEFVFPHLYKFENNRQTTFKFKPRLGYRVKNLLPIGAYAGQIWVGLSGSAESRFSYNTLSNLSEIPVTGNCTFDLHYNNTYTPLIPDSLNPLSGSNNFNNYWELYVTSLYWESNRKITCTIEFNPEDYKNIRLNDLVFIKEQYYRINKITGFNLSYRDTAEVELIRLYPVYYNYSPKTCGPVPTPSPSATPVTPTPSATSVTPTPTSSPGSPPPPGSATPTPTPTTTPTITPTITPTASGIPLVEFRLFQSGSSFEVPPIPFSGAQVACDSLSTRIAEVYTTSSALVPGTILYQEIGRVNLLPSGSYLISGSNQYVDIFPNGTVLLVDTCVITPTPTPSPVPPTYTYGVYGTNATTLAGFGSDTDACAGTGEVSFNLYSDTFPLGNGTILYNSYARDQVLTGSVDQWYAYIDGSLVRNSFRVNKTTGVVSLYTPCPSPSPTPSVTPSVTPTRTATPTITSTPSVTPTRTATPTITSTPSVTPTKTVTPTPTRTITPTPSPVCTQITLDWDPDSIDDVCLSPGSQTVYMDTTSFTTATKLSSSGTCTTWNAPVGYYKSGTSIRYWNGTTLGTATICPTPTPTPTPTVTPSPVPVTPTPTPSPTPSPGPTLYAINASYDATVDTNACGDWPLVTITVYGNGTDLSSSSLLYTNAGGTTNAPAGYYTDDGILVYYWNGSSFGFTAFC